MYSFQNTKPLNSSLNKENKGLVFYYLGDRTVIKTKRASSPIACTFYYLGDRTVIKTITEVATITGAILLPGRSCGNQDVSHGEPF